MNKKELADAISQPFYNICSNASVPDELFIESDMNRSINTIKKAIALYEQSQKTIINVKEVIK